MRAASTFPQIYICRTFVDFRKSIDGLSAVVETELKLAPFSGALFLFMSRRRDRVKVLYWDRTGFALWYKRLEEAKFAWPRGRVLESDVVTMTSEQLEWLLSGVDVWKIKAHAPLIYEKTS
jgi:transposase